MPTCQNCPNQFKLSEPEQRLLSKLMVPPPTFCPDCRIQRKLLWRNERTLYASQCAMCQKNMVMMYPPNTSHTIYC
ncbi:hypothetical protein KJ855_04790 [Patescibacteria group bacterium]|nr:hypothetical protein [Patescibacteria group bacterium]